MFTVRTNFEVSSSVKDALMKKHGVFVVAHNVNSTESNVEYGCFNADNFKAFLTEAFGEPECWSLISSVHSFAWEMPVPREALSDLIADIMDNNCWPGLSSEGLTVRASNFTSMRCFTEQAIAHGLLQDGAMNDMRSALVIYGDRV